MASHLAMSFLRDRVDGVDAMRKLLEPIKGLVKVDHDEMMAPHVQRTGRRRDPCLQSGRSSPAARRCAAATRWNSTAVYAQVDGRWKMAHNYWSYTTPDLKVPTVP